MSAAIEIEHLQKTMTAILDILTGAAGVEVLVLLEDWEDLDLVLRLESFLMREDMGARRKEVR